MKENAVAAKDMLFKTIFGVQEAVETIVVEHGPIRVATLATHTVGRNVGGMCVIAINESVLNGPTNAQSMGQPVLYHWRESVWRPWSNVH